VICDFNNTVVSFADETDISKRMLQYPVVSGEYYDLIDSTGESWELSFDEDAVISPLSLEKWTKKKLIDLCNNRDNRSDKNVYVLKNPDSKKLTVLIKELAEMLGE